MLNIDKSTQTSKYFRFRNIDDSTYDDVILPIWIKNEIEDKRSTILDYGCGLGQNLKAMRDEGYQNIYGVDIEKSAIEYCIKNDLAVRELDLGDLKNPFEFRFDVIILSHVIEHIPKEEIIRTLALIKKDFLAEDGKLLIAVPNAQSNTDSYWAYEDWTHTTLFTSGSLYYVLKAAGFETIEFLDIDCSLGISRIKTFVRRLFLTVYKANKDFWNKITCSAYHRPSPQIFSYELKAKAY